MRKRNPTRRAFVRGGLIGLVLAALIGCGPPTYQGPIAACRQEVTRFYETQEFGTKPNVPCMPVPPQRLDVYVETDGDPYGAALRGASYGGIQIPSDQPGWLLFRSVDPSKFN